MAMQRVRAPCARSLSKLLSGASLGAVAMLVLPSAAQAQSDDRYWDANGTAIGSGGSGAWNLGNLNWSPNGDGVSGPFVEPWDNGALDNAIFGGTAGTVTVGAPVTVGNLTFNSAGYVLNDSTITLGAPSSTIITATGNTTINSVIAGTSGLSKAGNGSLILNGANSFTGAININAGSLYAADDSALGAAGNNVFTAAASNVRLSIGGAGTARTVTIGNGGNLILEGPGAGSALITGNGSVSVAASGVTMSNDASTYTGLTVFSGCNGVCSARFTSLRNLGEASSLGAPVTVADGTIIFNQQSQYTDSLIYLGDGDSSNRNWDINGNGAQIRNQGTGTLDITGDIDISVAGTFLAESADFRLLGVLSGGTYGFASGAGRHILLGNANIFTGQANLSGEVRVGRLANIGSASSLGAGTTIELNNGVLSYIGAGDASNREWRINGVGAAIRNDGTGALDLSGTLVFNPANPNPDTLTLAGNYAGTNIFSGVMSGNGNIVADSAGTWVLGGANIQRGTVTVNNGTLRAGAAGAFGDATSVIVNGGTLDLGGFDLVAPSLTGAGGTVALGSANLTVDTATGTDDIFSGTITGTGGLTKTGNGFLTLRGANSYTGATTVNGGLLVLDFLGGPATNIISSASTLNMAGGRLTVFGDAGETNVQTFNGLNIVAGNNRIGAQSAGGGGVTINFGAINRSGGLIDFGLPVTGNFTTSNVSLGGWATVNGTDYAKVVGGNIVAFTDADYTDQDDASLWAAGQYISDSDGDADSFFGTVATDVQLAGLQFTTFDPTTTVTIAPTATLGVDGTIIVATTVGGNNQTITGGSLTGGSGGSTLGVQQNGTGTFIIGSTIVDNAGATSFAKAGSGIVRLTGANSYTGGTTLSGGRLEVTNLANGGVSSSIGASSADASNLLLESGTLAYTGGVDAVSNRGMTLVNGGAERAIEVGTGRTVEFSGLVTSPDDAGLTKTGAGTLTLSNAANDYVGVTTVTGGTLAVNTLTDGGVASGIGAASNASENIVLTTDGRLRYTGGTVTTDRGFTLALGNGRIDVEQAATTLTINGVATGSGNNFIKDGAGTLVLGGANTYTGDTIVTAGTLRAGSAQAFGPGGRYMTVNAGATLDLGGNDIYVAAIIGGGLVDLGGRTLTTAGGPGTFTGRITGTGGFTRGGGSYTQGISGCNNDYTGVTTISGGLVIDCIANGGQASAIGASSSASSNLVFAGGTLAYNGASASTDRGFALTGNGAINVVDPGTVLEFSGNVTGGGQLAKDGAGTLLLSGTNSSTGNLRIVNGTVRTGSTTALGSGPITLDNTAGVLLDFDGYNNNVLYLIGGGPLGGNIALGGATLTINAGGSAAAVYGGAISGSGGLVKNGGSFQQLSGCSSSYGGATVINAGTLAVACLEDGGANSSIGTSSSAASNLVLNGGALRYVGTGGATNRQFTLGASTASRLDASGTGAIVFTSAGPLTFASANTAQTLTLGGTSTDDNILAAQITNNGTGVTRLTKTDLGTWILTNPGSTYTGITTISGGVLGVDKLADGGVASSIGASSAAAANLIIGNGSTLRYTGAGDTTNRLFTLSQGVTFIESSGTGAIVFTDTGAVTLANNNQARTIALGGTNAGDNTLAGSIGNAGTGVTTLAKNDSGTWVLTGNHSYTGSTNINAGILSIGGGGTTGSIASAIVNNFGTLAFNRSDSLAYSGTIVGTGGLRQNGAGTTILTGANSYSGGTTISDGTLRIGNGGTTGSIVGNVVTAGDGVLAFNRSDGVIFGGAVSGTGSVRQTGGILALTGANTYSGGTTIDGGGTLQITSDANLGDPAGGITFDNGTLQVRAPIVSTRDVTLAGAGTINVDTSLDAGTTWTVGGDITGPGSLTKTGLGRLILTGDATHTGGTTLSQGFLSIGNGGTTGSIAGDILNNTGVAFDRSDSYTYSGAMTGSGSLSVDGGILTLTGNSSIGGNITAQPGAELRITAGNTVSTTGTSATANGGILTVSGAGSTLEASRVFANSSGANGAAINVENGGTIRTTVAGLTLRSAGGSTALVSLNVSGVGSLVDLAAGPLVVANTQPAAASVTVSNGGTIRSAGANVIGATTGNTIAPIVTITGAGSNWTSIGGTLAMTNGDLSVLDGGDATFASASVGTASAGNADMLVSGTNSTFTTTGNLVLGDGSGTGTITLIDAGRLTVGGTFTLANAAGSTGTLNIGGTGAPTAAGVLDAAALAFGPGTGSLVFNHTGTDYAFATAISGAGTIRQVAGVTRLTGDSSGFTGTTAISGGTLLVDGTLGDATSVTSVLGGGTLGGSGTIGGDVFVGGGARLAPGGSPGALTIDGDLGFSPNALLDFEFGLANAPGDPINDVVNVGGDLDLDGTLNVAVSPGGSFDIGLYRVINYGGALTDNGLLIGTVPAGTDPADLTVQTSIAGQVNLINANGVTLNFWDGAAGPKFNGAVNGGDGVWQNSAGNDNWTDPSGAVNAPFTDDAIAIFSAASGTVTADDSFGAVSVGGMQFASNGYLVTGDAVTLANPQSVIRVGDGTGPGAGYTATIDSVLTGPGVQLVKTDLGTLVLTGANTYTGGTLINAGTIRISQNLSLGDNGGVLSFNGGTLNTASDIAMIRNVDLIGAGTFETDAGTLLNVNGVVSGGGALVKDGVGLMVLIADNTYTGGTTVDLGILQIGSGTTGSILGDVVNNAALAFGRSDNLVFGGTISGGGSVSQLGAGVLTLTADNSYTGTTAISSVNAGTLQLGNGGTTGSIAGNVANGGTLTFNRSNEYVFAGAISGTGAVRQLGAGTTILTAANSYTGTTDVASGMLLINGNQSAATGLTTVDAGATLGGVGTIGGDVSVAGTLAPGDAAGPGTLTINGNLGFSPNAALAYDFGQSDVIGGPLNDLTQVGGDLVLDGTIDVTVSAGGVFDVGVYRVISYGGTLTDNVLDIGADPSGGTVSVQTSVANQVNLVNTAGLTLNFWDGAAGPKADGAVNGGDGIWQNSTGNDNWTEETGGLNAAFADAAFAIFSAAPGTVTVDNGPGQVSASGMQFASDGYTITGGDLTLVGPQSVIRVGDGTAAGSGFTATISSALTGTSRLIKTDLGTLVLSGSNTYSGGTMINGGTLRISSDANLGDAAGDLGFDGGRLNTTADIATARDVNFAGAGTLVTDAATTLTLGGAISGTGALTKTGTGTLVLAGSGGHTGGTSVSAGTLFVNGNLSGATGAMTIATGATLGGTGTIGGDVTLADGATLAPGADGVGTLSINGALGLGAGTTLDFQFGQANAAGGGLNDLVSVGGNLALDGTINVSVPAGGSFGGGIYRVFDYGGTLIDNGLTLGTLPAGGDVSVQTAIAGQVNLVNTAGLDLSFWDGAAGPKNNNAIDGGNGIWRVGGGSNNWTELTGAVNADYAQGSFAVFAGVPGAVTVDDIGGAVQASGLQFAVGGYILDGDTLTLTGPQATIRVGDGTAAGAGYTATVASELTGTATLVKTDAGTLVLTGTNSYSGGTAIEGGIVRIGSDANLGAAAGALGFDGGTLNTTASFSSGRTVNLVGAGTLLTEAGTTLTLTGAMSGAGNLAKSGTGTLTLAGTGGHTGGTNVTAGTLLVNGNYAAATGTMTVVSGASLGGTGTIGGDVTLADGATLTPGAGGTGTLTINGDLALSGGTRLAYEFGQANSSGGVLNDLVDVGGDLTLDGTIDVTVPVGGSFDVGVYRVFDYGGALTNNGLTLGALPVGSEVSVQTSIAGQVNLVNAAGLVLNFWDGAAGPKNNGVINGGDGIWQGGAGNDNWTEATGAVNASYDDGAFAIFGGTGGTVTVDNSLGAVTASGMQFASNGYTISGGDLTFVGPQSTIRVGDGSTDGAGFTARIDAALGGATQLVKTDAGTLVLDGTNSYTGGTLVNGGTVQISADANLGAATGDLTLDGGTLATSASLTSARDIVMAGAGTISTASGTTFTFDGLLSGAGALTKAGAGTLIMTANNEGYLGSTQVEGTLAVNGSLCGDVNVRANGRLQGTGTVCTTISAGTVAPGNSIGTLTVAGSYTGNNGTLEIEAELGGDASPTDRLVVTSGTAGATQVVVVNTGGLGAQTNEGIKIVDVTGGASSGTFTLRGDYVFQGSPAIVAGAYGYRLFQGGVSTPTDGDWYLRSALLDGSGEPEGPLYQPGVPLYESYAGTLQTLNGLPTLQERVGNRQWSGFTQSGIGMWGRMEGNRLRPEAAVSTSGSDVNTNTWTLQVGFDATVTEADGGVLVAGVNGRYGTANARVRSQFGNGQIDTKGYSLGATVTWYGNSGFYADAQAQASWYDSDLDSDLLGSLVSDSDGSGEAFSFEIGQRLPIGGSLSVTPQAQVVYSNVRFDGFIDPNDATVTARNGDSLRGRLGLSVDHQEGWREQNGGTGRSHFYGFANLEYEMLDGSGADVSGTPILRRDDRLWGELGIGGSYSWNDGRFTIFSEVSANTALSNFGDSNNLGANAGFRMRF